MNNFYILLSFTISENSGKSSSILNSLVIEMSSYTVSKSGTSSLKKIFIEIQVYSFQLRMGRTVKITNRTKPKFDMV